MNAVVIAVIVMLALSLARVHVVLSLTVGAFAGGLLAGMPLTDVADAAGKVSQPGIITVFQNGLSGGAKIALSYAMLGAFAMAITILVPDSAPLRFSLRTTAPASCCGRPE